MRLRTCINRQLRCSNSWPAVASSAITCIQHVRGVGVANLALYDCNRRKRDIERAHGMSKRNKQNTNNGVAFDVGTLTSGAADRQKHGGQKTCLVA